MGTPTNRFIRQLTSGYRVIALGGLAVIAHGHSRSTLDGDIWLEPMSDPAAWANFLENQCNAFGNLTIHRLPGWTRVAGPEIAEAIEETSVVRVLGLDCPLDIFRKPNEVEIEAFDTFCERGTKRSDGTILPHPLDLIETKLDTGREKDLQDISFLESLVRTDYKQRLPTAPPEEARAMLERYSEWQVLRAALSNPAPEIRELAMCQLKEFAEAGDPFSLAILEGREIPLDD